MTEPTVYLLHFDKQIHHAQHYIGCTIDLDKRISQHRKGWSGAGLVRAFRKHKITFTVAITWNGDHPSGLEGWELERHLKKHYKSARKLCPICRAERMHHEASK